MKPQIERFARTLDPATTQAVRAASAIKVESRGAALRSAFADVEAARSQAASIKSHVLDNLRELLLQFEVNAKSNGWHVHWAADAASARRFIVDLCRGHSLIVKGKSMATEEIHLNHALEEAGFEVVETDLGEFVVQIDHDTPSHIVTPIIHKSRIGVAKSFRREGLGAYTEDPGELAGQARAHLRAKFQGATVGISGVNFALVEEGAIVVCENEGNNRLSTTAPDVHIAIMGLEKLLPSRRDLPLFLRLLAGSATGQRATVYTHFINGPRKVDELDGPRETHLVILDNGRSNVLSSRYRDILRCIRCGACLNVCPVYRQVSGHAYRGPYSGPLGAVLAPALEGVKAMGDLAKASSLCGACEDACPVAIPIPDLLLKLREEGVRKQAVSDGIPWGVFAATAGSAWRWKAGLAMLPMATQGARDWNEYREPPTRVGRPFRDWWIERSP